jgi:hypothetical protein
MGNINGTFAYIGGIGGLCGAALRISNCFNYGSVTGFSLVGGIAGGVSVSSTSVSDCYNTGSIQGGKTGYNNENTGGIIGSNSGTVSACYNAGKVSTNGGSLIGTNNRSVTNCYYDYRRNVSLPAFRKNGETAAFQSVGLSTLEMTENAYWAKDDVMPALKQGFVKRNPDNPATAYYPELAVFYNGTDAWKAASKQSVSISNPTVDVGQIIPPVIFPGEKLTVTPPYISSQGDSEGWEIKHPDADVWTAYDESPLELTHNGWLLRYVVRTTVKDYASNTVEITVRKINSVLLLQAGIDGAKTKIVLTAEFASVMPEGASADPNPDKQIVFYADGLEVGRKSTSSGIATCEFVPGPNPDHVFKAEFEGDNRYYGSTSEIDDFNIDKQDQFLQFDNGLSNPLIINLGNDNDFLVGYTSVGLSSAIISTGTGVWDFRSDNESVATIDNNYTGLWIRIYRVEGTANLYFKRKSNLVENESNELVLHVVTEKGVHNDAATPVQRNVVYGQTLADVDLPPRFTWNDPLETPVGDYNALYPTIFKATYTPENTDIYRTITDVDIKLIVYRAATTILVPPIVERNISKGWPVSQAEIIGGQANVPGNFSWENNSDIAAATGNKVRFQPDDWNYEPLTLTLDITLYDSDPYSNLIESALGVIQAAANEGRIGGGHNQISDEASGELNNKIVEIENRIISAPYLTQQIFDEACDELNDDILKLQN